MTTHDWARPRPTTRLCRRCGRHEHWEIGKGWMVQSAGVGGLCVPPATPPPPPQLPPPPATWGEPRRVEEWWWLDLNEWSAPGVLKRCGRVSWNADGTGHYRISLSYEDIGLGLSCWPDFHALWAAQAYIEVLWALPLDQVEALHGTQWPNVVL